MRPRNRDIEPGSLMGRRRDWITVTTLAVPTVWMAAPSGLVCLDLIAVEFAVNGIPADSRLTPPEAAYAAAMLLQRGVDRWQVAKLTGRDYRTLRSWFPNDDTPLSVALARIGRRDEQSEKQPLRRDEQRVKRPRRRRSEAEPPCGTYLAAQRHRKRKEPLDGLCREAKRVADRYYRKHGTYIGAPSVAA
ncbi:hypothetical protein [Streptomyces sp. NPDC002952]|uniref:hypothetical protein n=1 Tax=Streptomyces sp. NPDC002952 TaxID=3364673 RepID=UPI00369AA37A